MLLGCIADDFTGATDLANTLVKQGMRTVQVIGVPSESFSYERPSANTDARAKSAKRIGPADQSPRRAG